MDGEGLRAGVVSQKNKSGEGQVGRERTIIGATETVLLWHLEWILEWILEEPAVD